MSDDEIRDMIRKANEHGLLLVKATVIVPLCEELLRLRADLASTDLVAKHLGQQYHEAMRVIDALRAELRKEITLRLGGPQGGNVKCYGKQQTADIPVSPPGFAPFAKYVYWCPKCGGPSAFYEQASGYYVCSDITQCGWAGHDKPAVASSLPTAPPARALPSAGNEEQLQ